MNQIYRFQLSIQENGNTVAKTAYPVYANNAAVEYNKESNQEFFRKKLNGKLTFESADYDWIMLRAFDTEYTLILLISADGGTTWAEYWRGVFYRTDCEIDQDRKTISVTPNARDRYTEVLNGIDKEFDLITLAPQCVPVKYNKRPMIQIYVPGQSVIGCFLSGMYWEQECEVVQETDTVGSQNKLTDYLHFIKNAEERVIDVTQQGTPTIPDVFIGAVNATQFTNGGFKINLVSGPGVVQWQIVRISDNVVLWLVNNPVVPGEITLTPVSGSGATGNVKLNVHDVAVYARYVTDVESARGQNSFPIPSDDMVANNRNYSRVIGWEFPDSILFSTQLSTTPTQYGIYLPGQYYVMATNPYAAIDESFPIARAAWGRVSIWFAFPKINWEVERAWSKETTLKDAYPLSSVISVLLGQIAPNVTHQATTAYSEFLYDTTNPISGISQTLFVTPKSNILSSGYDQPAQTAKVTLGQVLNMLRDCFRCYWFIDEDNHFCIEHILYFRLGGTYRDAPIVGTNLTTELVPRSGKPWAFCLNKYKFDKPDMAGRYEFGWMDEVTQLFEGFPIDIVSPYVEQGQVEQISVAHFTSDIDYMLLNPSEISKDGFALLGAYLDGNDYRLPYIDFGTLNTPRILQNGYVAFAAMQGYYAYDMPAYHYTIDGEDYQAVGVKRTKTQEVTFPVINDPNPMELVETGLGRGAIQKISINLSSRNANATLIYEPE